MHFFKSQAHDFVDSCLSMYEFKHIMAQACSFLDWSVPTEKDTRILLHYMSLYFPDVLMEQTESLKHFSPEAKVANKDKQRQNESVLLHFCAFY